MKLNEVCQFMSIEKKDIKASNSELRRWFSNKAVEINFSTPGAEEPLPPVIKSLVLFPKSKTKRTTLIWDDTITLIQIDESVLT
jgi:hypothetical protein